MQTFAVPRKSYFLLICERFCARVEEMEVAGGGRAA